MRHAFLRPIVLAIAIAVTACGSSDNSTSPTTTTPSTELFEGKLQGAGDSMFFSFTVGTAGNVDVTLASVTSATSPGTSANVLLGLGLGSPLATDCNVTSQVATRPGLTTQLTGTNFAPAIYCVRVFDVGNLTTPVNFAIRIVHT